MGNGARQGGRGGTILDAYAISADPTTAQVRFPVSLGETFSVHVQWAAPSSFTGAFTLWASNLADPDETVDADWVQMTSDHGFSGLAGGDPTTTSSAGGDIIDIGNAGAAWYRVKMVRSAGSANISYHVSIKDEK